MRFETFTAVMLKIQVFRDVNAVLKGRSALIFMVKRFLLSLIDLNP